MRSPTRSRRSASSWRSSSPTISTRDCSSRYMRSYCARVRIGPMRLPLALRSALQAGPSALRSRSTGRFIASSSGTRPTSGRIPRGSTHAVYRPCAGCSESGSDPDFLLTSLNQNRSVPEMLGKLPRPDFAAEDIAHRVYGNAFGGAGALHLLRIGNAVEDFAGLELADADAAEPAGVRGDTVGFGVGDVDEAVAQVYAARAAELLPLGDEGAVLLEDLDAVVAAVGNEEPPVGVHGDIVRGLELGGP